MPRLILLPASLLLLPQAAQAHGGVHKLPGDPIGWTFDPGVTIPLAIALLAYAIGFVRLDMRRSLWQSAALFGAGWLVLTLSLVSPLHEGGERSFALHMIEHELIMLVAALLLPLSRPLGVMLWSLPRAGRRALAPASGWLQRLASPFPATMLQAGALWAWHAPPLFNRALGHPAWHVAQHLTFLVTALLFWQAMLRTPHKGLAALCLFVTSIVGGALGALMALSASPWYESYAAMGMMPFGLTPQEDQQIAGLIMWVPGGLVHAGAALLLLARYLTSKPARSMAF
ncbi:MAG: cytochrome c oxidase assembly protein [Proteobacteria bacterium]|nr:cytochrome c oxidase assembly protein [Pseudomonadota bacterium]